MMLGQEPLLQNTRWQNETARRHNANTPGRWDGVRRTKKAGESMRNATSPEDQCDGLQVQKDLLQENLAVDLCPKK